MIEQAKKIIEKGKLLNDPELVKIGLDMLDAVGETKEKPVVSPSRDFTDQFRVERGPSTDIKYGRKVSLSREDRVNKWVDTGVEFSDLKGKTPPATPKTKRKVEKVEVQCSVCGKTETVLKSLLFTENYRCDRCVLKGKA
jgi:hypothetical protein